MNLESKWADLKPQQFTGAMWSIRELEGSCTCGQNARHEPVVGRERSRASGTYPDALCNKYARCAISQELLHYKEMRLKQTILERKAKSEAVQKSKESKEEETSSSAKPASAHRKRAKRESESSADFGGPS